MRATVVGLAGALSLWCASAFAAEGKIALLPFTGPGAPAVRTKLAESLCLEVDCVPASKVTKKGKPNLPAAKKAHVVLFVSGKVVGPAAKRTLKVVATDLKGKKQVVQSLPLVKGKPAAKGVKVLTAKLEEKLGGGKAAPEEEAPPKEEGTEVSKKEPPEKTEPEKKEPEKTPAEEPERKPVSNAVAPSDEGVEAHVGAKAPTGNPLFNFDVEADFVNRSLSYQDLKIQNLRAYDTRPFLLAPALHAELYPLARSVEGAAAGAGLEIGYLFAVGLRTIDENNQAHTTSFSRFDFGARWRFGVGEGLFVAPHVGYRSTRFSVGAAPDGSVLAGLPEIHYDGLRIGVDADYSPRPWALFGRLSYLHVLSTGEIGSRNFFPADHALGFELQGGGGWYFRPNVEARLALNFTRYSHTFNATSGSAYQATGATDQYLGAMAGLRLEY